MEDREQADQGGTGRKRVAGQPALTVPPSACPDSLPQGAAEDAAPPHLSAGGPVPGVRVVHGGGHGHLPAQVPG